MGQGTVIVESSFKRGGKRSVWIASELTYRTEKDKGVYLSRPLVLSIDDDRQKGRMESVLAAVLDAKGAYFEQIMEAVRDKEKEGVV